MAAKRGRTIADTALFGGFTVSGSAAVTFAGGVVQLRLTARSGELGLESRTGFAKLLARTGEAILSPRTGLLRLAERNQELSLPEL
jgi:hypothetical protein